jgi:S-adenosylmethionine/arginine decarboxylase-like enzyme
MLDGYARYGKFLKFLGLAPEGILADTHRIRLITEEMVHQLGFSVLGEVRAHQVPELDPSLPAEASQAGVLSIAALDRGFFILRTWPARGRFLIDICVSCDFESNKAMRLIEDHLGSINFVMRDLSMSLRWGNG